MKIIHFQVIFLLVLLFSSSAARRLHDADDSAPTSDSSSNNTTQNITDQLTKTQNELNVIDSNINQLSNNLIQKVVLNGVASNPNYGIIKCANITSESAATIGSNLVSNGEKLQNIQKLLQSSLQGSGSVDQNLLSLYFKADQDYNKLVKNLR